MTSASVYHVLPAAGRGWEVRLEGGGKRGGFASRDEALRAVDLEAERRPFARVVVHFADQTVEQEYLFHGEPRKIRLRC
jgi:hypothetical protein